MSEHNLHKITLRHNAPISKVVHLVRESDSTLYALHKALWKLFPSAQEERNEDKEKLKRFEIANIPPQFIYRKDTDENGFPVLHVVSKHTPVDTQGIWKIETAQRTIEQFVLQTSIKQDTVLEFSLCVNPTKTVDTDSKRDYKDQIKPLNPKKSEDMKTKRIDVIWQARSLEIEAELKSNDKERLSAEQRTWNNQQVIHSAALTWLNDIAPAKGFDILDNTLVVKSYQRVLNPKKQRDIKSMKEFNEAEKLSLLDVSGFLRVTDTDTFLYTLTHGIGHAKAWGCGLLLIKRA